MSPHLHCGACGYPVEVADQLKVATPAYVCPRCRREMPAYSWQRLREVRAALEGISSLEGVPGGSE